MPSLELVEEEEHCATPWVMLNVPSTATSVFQQKEMQPLVSSYLSGQLCTLSFQIQFSHLLHVLFDAVA